MSYILHTCITKQKEKRDISFDSYLSNDLEIAL
ncbi:hypothetical protein PDE_06850 [Penicillium oxalicum 114-2]|uniref:Uncharacterized protein n=1 Tax=Penicillium oxalicum (strain 114-2 / CGMCC 5302) TaxID=933388 RepID=S8BAR2_PENO1|nr:hypothetical protein PDE_06850 [Penicillium oxalicum 114-2]